MASEFSDLDIHKLSTLKDYVANQYQEISNGNINQGQALVNIIDLSEKLNYGNYEKAIEQVRLVVVGDDLNNPGYGDYQVSYFGKDYLKGATGFKEQFVDDSIQIIHAVTGLYLSAKYGELGYWTAYINEYGSNFSRNHNIPDTNSADFQLYSEAKAIVDRYQKLQEQQSTEGNPFETDSPPSLADLVEEALLKDENDENEKNRCFAAGTQIDMADGSRKPIETIKVGDEVMAYDPAENKGLGGLRAAKVTRTMVNQVPHLLDFHGVKVTPGHATLCGDGLNKGCHIPLMDILLADGAVVNRDGKLIRAATNLPMDSEGDQFVEVAYITSKSQKTYFRGRMRAGTLTLDEEGNTHRVLDALKREGYRLHPDGLIAKDDETPHPLYWFGELPKPADYVLKKSGLTLAELYSAEGRELAQPAPASNSKIGANLGAVYAGMTVN